MIAVLSFILCIWYVNAATRVIAANDPAITYLGRVQKDGQTVKFDWSGIQISIDFELTSSSHVECVFEDNGNGKEHINLNEFILMYF